MSSSTAPDTTYEFRTPRPHDADEGGVFPDVDFDILDDEGNPIDPASEGSCLVALDLLRAGAFGPPNSEGACSSMMVEQPTNNWEDVVGIEELERVLQQDGEVGPGSSPTTSDPNLPYRVVKHARDADGVLLVDDEEEHGDDAEDDWEGQRTRSNGLFGGDDEDEWTLDKVIGKRKRKMTKAELENQEFPEEDDARYVEDDEIPVGSPASIKTHLKNSRGRYLVEYQCKWKWYKETTWEPQLWMEEQGYRKKIELFENPPKKKEDEEDTPPVPWAKGVFASSYAMEHLFGGKNMYFTIRRKFHDCGLDIQSFANITDSKLVMDFLGKAKQLRSGITLLFHGTNAGNIQAIRSKGLRIPGGASGIRVAHGSVHGCGVYTSRTPSTPAGYCCYKKEMLVCAAIVTPTVKCVHQDWFVFFEEGLVIPVWAVKWERGCVRESPLRVDPDLAGGSLPSVKLDYGEKPTPFEHQHALKHGLVVPGSSSGTGPKGRTEHIPKLPKGKLYNAKKVRQAPRYLKDLWKSGQLNDLMKNRIMY